MRYPFLWTWISLQISYLGMLSVTTVLVIGINKRVKRIEGLLVGRPSRQAT